MSYLWYRYKTQLTCKYCRERGVSTVSCLEANWPNSPCVKSSSALRADIHSLQEYLQIPWISCMFVGNYSPWHLIITSQWSTKANNRRSTMILPLSISWTGNALRGEMSSLSPGECFTAECKLHGLTPVLSHGTKPLTRRCMYPSNKCCELLFRKYSVQVNIK